jgi:hypothetical protein
MMQNLNKDMYWFRSSRTESIFFPFGLSGNGYYVAHSERDRIARWGFWHAQIPTAIFILIVLPALAFLPSTFAHDRLTGWLALLSIGAFYCGAALGVSWIAGRVMYGVLLGDCPRADRHLSREEQRSCTGQIGGRLFVSGRASTLICQLGGAAALATGAVGLVRLDAPSIAVGLVSACTFFCPLVATEAEDFVKTLKRRRNRRTTFDERRGASALPPISGRAIE